VDPDADTVGVASTEGANEPAWRQRAVSRSLHAARSRAEERVQRFLDTAFALIDEKGTTEFTIQEVIDRSRQSLRAFYQCFEGKDELLLALFEETVREALEDIRAEVATETDPLERLRACTIRLHEWCDPADAPRKRGAHNRRPIMEFSVHLVTTHPDRVRAALTPTSRLVIELVEAASAAGAVKAADPRHAAALIQQTVMCSWLGSRLARDARMRVTAEETWAFCLHGISC
jgi:AcrR family transcriptional regulator